MTDEQRQARADLMASNHRYDTAHVTEVNAGKKARQMDENVEAVLKPGEWAVWQARGGNRAEFEAQWPTQRLAIWERGVHDRMEKTLARKRKEAAAHI